MRWPIDGNFPITTRFKEIQVVVIHGETIVMPPHTGVDIGVQLGPKSKRPSQGR